MAGASLAYRIFAVDVNAEKTLDRIGKASSNLGGKLALLGKASGIVALGMTAMGVAGVAGIATLIASIGGLGAALAGVGLFFASQNSRVQQSFDRLSTHVQSRMRSMSAVFVPVMLHLSSVLGHTFDDAQPQIAKALDRLAPTTSRMVDGIGGALHGLIPAIQPVVSAAIPLLDRLASHLPGIGAAFGRMLIRVSGFVQRITPQIKPGFDKAVDAVKGAAHQISGAVGDVWGSATANRIKGKWPGVRDAVVSGVTKLVTSVRDKAVDVGSGLFNGIKDGLSTGDWSGLGNTLGSLVRDQVSKAFKIATTITESLGKAISSVDWVGLGIDIGKEAPSLAGGFVTGLFNFDVGNALSGIGDHWRDILLGLLAIAFTPAKVIGKIAGMLDKIPLVGPLLSWILRGTKAAADGAVGAGGKLVGAIGKGIMSGFRRVFPEVGARFTLWLSDLPTRLGLARIAVTEKAKALVKAVGDAILSGAEAVGRAIGTIIGKITKPFANAGGWLVRKGADAIGGLAKGIGNALGKVASPLRSIGGKVVGWVGDLSRVLIGAGKAVIDGLVSGIKSRVSKVTNAVSGIGGKIKNTFKSVMGIFSPSRAMAELGRHTVAGLVQGMKSQHPAVAAAVAGLAGSISGPTAGVQFAAAGGRSAGASAAVVGMAHQITINTGPAPADPREIGAAVAWALRTGGA